VVSSLSESVIRNTCSQFNADDYQVSREEISSRMEELVEHKSEYLYADVVELQLQDITRPTKYEEAVQDIESVRTDITKSKNERDQALVEANTKLELAQQQANQILYSASVQSKTIQVDAENKAKSTISLYTEKASVLNGYIQSNGLSSVQLIELVKNSILNRNSRINLNKVIK
ncbi:MAG: hypothetical protein K0U10_06690, partial [Gammaproteobacteria bacterium]|nr:hypothetical protein [Gammaproteobacteria bacterium]